MCSQGVYALSSIAVAILSVPNSPFSFQSTTSTLPSDKLSSRLMHLLASFTPYFRRIVKYLVFTLALVWASITCAEILQPLALVPGAKWHVMRAQWTPLTTWVHCTSVVAIVVQCHTVQNGVHSTYNYGINQATVLVLALLTHRMFLF